MALVFGLLYLLIGLAIVKFSKDKLRLRNGKTLIYLGVIVSISSFFSLLLSLPTFVPNIVLFICLIALSIVSLFPLKDKNENKKDEKPDQVN